MEWKPLVSSLEQAGRGAALGALLGFLLRDLLPLEMASAWVFPALLGAVLWSARGRIALGALLLGTTVVWLLVAFGPLAGWLGSGLVRREAPGPADAVYVLGSRVQVDGDPTAAAQARLLRGVELVAGGFAPVLAVADLAPPAASHPAAAARLTQSLGVEVAEIVPVGPVGSTRDEALKVTTLARQRGWGRLLVVTSPLHSGRACGSIEHEGLEVVCAPSVETEYDVESLDRPVERLVAFRRALRETLAQWVYKRRGWLGP